jgi:hypothetical protein
MKIRPVGAELFYSDRRTDMKLIVAFRSSAKASKIVIPQGIATRKVSVLNNDVLLFVLSMQWRELTVIILRVMCLFISEQEKTAREINNTETQKVMQ